MRNALLPHQRLDSYQAAKQLYVLVHQAKIKHTTLRDQAERAALSTLLQLAEGLPNDSGPMRRKYFTEARNSLFETVTAMDAAHAVGMISTETYEAVQSTAARLRALLVGLLR